jgi:hypothetical protein
MVMANSEPHFGWKLFPHLYREGRYLFFLVSLLLLFFFYPFFAGLRFAPRLLGILFLAILISGVSSISSSRRAVATATCLAVLAFGSYVGIQLTTGRFFHVLTASSFALFFAFVTVVVLRHILSTKEVTTDTILGAMCAYLLLGMVWAMVFSLIETLAPGSFLHGGQSLAASFPEARQPVISSFIYYSFVTLTTLGYGDITPGSSPAAALSSLEAVTGQLYIAILIARLVAQHIASGRNTSRG